MRIQLDVNLNKTDGHILIEALLDAFGADFLVEHVNYQLQAKGVKTQYTKQEKE